MTTRMKSYSENEMKIVISSASRKTLIKHCKILCLSDEEVLNWMISVFGSPDADSLSCLFIERRNERSAEREYAI